MFVDCDINISARPQAVYRQTICFVETASFVLRAASLRRRDSFVLRAASLQRRDA